MKGMITFVLALILVVISLLGVAMRKVYYYLPAKELKRQAEGGSVLARKLWPAVSYGSSLRVYLWLWIGIAAAAAFALLARLAPWEFGFIATLLVIWLAFAWFPSRIKVSGLEARLTGLVTPVVAWKLRYLHPLLDRTLAPLVRQPGTVHTNLFEIADLLELLDRQEGQEDNRIPAAELNRAKQALSARQYKVSDVMVPRLDVKFLSDGDTVGLLLLDELHATGQSSFPVRAGSSDRIIGTLYLHDLGLKTEGRVRDYMQSDVKYLHEDDSLDQALQAFYKTKLLSFVVVNSFEEFVGIVTLEAIVQHLAGDAQAAEFDQYHDMSAVAAKHANDAVADPEPQAPAEEVIALDEDEKNNTSDDLPVSDSSPEGEVLANDEDSIVVVTDEDSPAIPEDNKLPEAEEIASEDNAEEDNVDPESLAALDLPDEAAEQPAEPTPKPDKPTSSQ